MKSVALFHGSAHTTGVCVPLVSYACTGSAQLVSTFNHPGGAAVITCSGCKVVFDVYRRSDQQRKVARRAQRRIFIKVALTILVGALCSATLAAVVAASHGPLLDALKYGTWLPTSIMAGSLSLAVMVAGWLVRTSELIARPRTQAGLHVVKFQKNG